MCLIKNIQETRVQDRNIILCFIPLFYIRYIYNHKKKLGTFFAHTSGIKWFLLHVSIFTVRRRLSY